jgi:hypothetical protein
MNVALVVLMIGRMVEPSLPPSRLRLYPLSQFAIGANVEGLLRA